MGAFVNRPEFFGVVGNITNHSVLRRGAKAVLLYGNQNNIGSYHVHGCKPDGEYIVTEIHASRLLNIRQSRVSNDVVKHGTMFFRRRRLAAECAAAVKNLLLVISVEKKMQKAKTYVPEDTEETVEEFQE